jgi:hypothetical protein
MAAHILGSCQKVSVEQQTAYRIATEKRKDEGDDEDHDAVEDAVIRIEDKLDQLMAEFEEIMGGGDDESDSEFDDDAEEASNVLLFERYEPDISPDDDADGSEILQLPDVNS